MGRAIGRLILVPLACLLASIAAGGMLVTLGLERATHAMHGGLEVSQLEALFELLLKMGGIAWAASVLPAVLLVIVGEVARIRSLTYYVAGGGAALALLPLLTSSAEPGKGLLEAGALWQVFATAGFAGGLVYWLVAGRSA